MTLGAARRVALAALRALLESPRPRKLGFGVQTDVDKLALLLPGGAFGAGGARRVVDLRDAVAPGGGKLKRGPSAIQPRPTLVCVEGPYGNSKRRCRRLGGGAA
jgi:hypothetical protein